jgi:UDP-N-acetylmuramate--alanine ligase
MKSYEYIHFIGIGGISMSGLAEIMLKRGCRVSGSDTSYSSFIKHLKDLGADIVIGHTSSVISSQDLVVFTSAARADNPELMEASKLGIKTLERADFLGELMKDYVHPIAVSGTHGKTTTTGFMTSILLMAKKDPTILIGGDYNLIDGNIRVGSADILLTEACEYKRSFTRFNPEYGIVLNIEEDHLDYYLDIKDIKNAFREFAKNIPKEGYLIYNYDDQNSKGLFDDLECNLISFGLTKGSTVRARNLKYTPYPEFDLYYGENMMGKFRLSVPGEHNVYNALAAAACSQAMNINVYDIRKGIEDFSGTKRRFELRGELNGAVVIDDYAHHPTEIKTTLKTVKGMSKKRTFCVFQPHTFTRTHSLLTEFSEAFHDADVVLVTDIYPAREEDTGLVHSKDLVKALKTKGVEALYCSTFEEAEDYLRKNVKKSDSVITMGAGDVYLIADHLTGKQ